MQALLSYSGFQPHEVQADRCPRRPMPYALCPMPNPQTYLIEQRRAIYGFTSVDVFSVFTCFNIVGFCRADLLILKFNYGLCLPTLTITILNILNNTASHILSQLDRNSITNHLF